MYSLSFFKNFGSDSSFIIDEEIINKLVAIAKKMNIGIKLTEDTPVIYQFNKLSFVQKMATKVLTNNEKTEIEIKSWLNKVTEENYVEISENLLKIMDESNFPIIFNISYKNKFFSETYAKLTIKLCANEQYKDYLFQRLEKMIVLFDDILYLDNEYENNKWLDDRIALCCFYTNLYVQEIINETSLLNFITYILTKVESCIDIENNKSQVEEMLDVLFSVLTIAPGLKFDKSFIEKLSKSNNKLFKSITNKSIFKCMDIMDLK